MNKYKINREQAFYLCVLAGCFLLYLLWAVVIPFNHAPDEGMRYQIPQFIYQYGHLPHGGDERIRSSVWGFSYGFTPIFSYIISAIFMKITSLFTTSPDALLLSARLTSVLFSTGTVYFCIKISKKIFKGIFGYAFVISVALLPQFVFISSYVNNDAFGIFTVAWIIYALLLANEKKWDIKSCLFLGAGIGLCLISYYNCYGIIVVAFVYAIVSVCVDKDIDNKLKFILIRILWVAAAAFVVAGWWFIRNAILYNGDFLGMKTSGEYAERYAAEAFKPSNRQTPYNTGVSLGTMLIDMEWIESSIISFIGMFEYMGLPLDDWCYITMYVIAIGGLVGSFVPMKLSRMDKKLCSLTLRLSMLLMGVITIGISMWYSYFNDFQAQGRYCLPMLISLNLIIIYGWNSIFNRFNKTIQGFVVFLIILSYCIVNIYTTCYTIIPKYSFQNLFG